MIDTGKKEVVFVYPNPYSFGERRIANILNMPVAYLVLSGFLEKHGIPCRIIDTRAEDYRSYDYSNALFLGMTALTGAMIGNGLDIADHVRKQNPDLPIIWGGPHPSSLPAETLEHPLVDAVCIGEGEPVVLPLAQALLEGKSIDGIPGLLTSTSSLKRAAWMDLNEIPPLPYEKLKLERYQNGSFFEFATSRGCPHRCVFCYNLAFNRDPDTGNPSYRFQSAEHAVEQLEIVCKKHKMQMAGFVDDNLFGRRQRPLEIAQGIIKKGLDFRWFANCVASYFRGFDDAYMRALKDAGCFRLDIGGESGSPDILNMVGKGTRPSDLLNSAKKCHKVGIVPSYSFIIGWPDETDEDLEMTLSVIDQLAREVPCVWINGVYVITPFPGTPYLDIAVEGGFVPPGSLQGWADQKFAVETEKYIPWHSRQKRDRLNAIARFSKTDFLPGKAYRNPYTGWVKNVAHRLMSIDARTRWKNRSFGHTYEWKAWDWLLRTRNKF